MITSDQLKDVLDRADALYKYLKIDEKKMEYESRSGSTVTRRFALLLMSCSWPSTSIRKRW